MIVKLIGETIVISHKAVNTDHAESEVGQNIVIGQEPEESEDRVWVLDAVQYSYFPAAGVDIKAKPVAGGIDIHVGDKKKWSADISDFTGVLNLYIPSQTDKVIAVTLKGTSGYVGKLNVQWHLEPVN